MLSWRTSSQKFVRRCGPFATLFHPFLLIKPDHLLYVVVNGGIRIVETGGEDSAFARKIRRRREPNVSLENAQEMGHVGHARLKVLLDVEAVRYTEFYGGLGHQLHKAGGPFSA